MSVTVDHPDPWTIADLYNLPADGMRHELLDGTLLVSPPPAVPHQLAAHRLVNLLSAAAPADVEVLEATGVRLPAGLLVPDVVVAQAKEVYAATRELPAQAVLAVVEIVSPSSIRTDRLWKPSAYAEGGIATFWRVEQTTRATVHVHALAGDCYRELTRVTAPESVTVSAPFPVTVAPSELSGPAAT